MLASLTLVLLLLLLLLPTFAHTPAFPEKSFVYNVTMCVSKGSVVLCGVDSRGCRVHKYVFVCALFIFAFICVYVFFQNSFSTTKVLHHYFSLIFQLVS